MKIDFEKLTEPYRKEAIETLQKFISIKSIYDESSISKTMPYGKDVNNILNFMKEFAAKKGFKTEIVGNRAVEITFGDSGKEVGIFGHLDTVPVSGKWTFDPFSGTIKDGKIIGRGSADDKGPVIASLFALIALKDNNLIDNFKIRMVCGGDEERGSSCLTYYFEEAKKKPVDTGFTPDADYPLIYAEKGIINYSIKGNIDLGKDIISIDSGIASNVVIPQATVTLKDASAFIKFLENNNVKFQAEGNKVTFIGKAAHGAVPQLGINAGLIMLKYLGEFYNNDVLRLLALQYSDPSGKNMKKNFTGKELGETTYNVGIIKYDGHTFEFIVNFRFPENVDGKKILNEIQDISPLPIYVIQDSKLIYFDKSSTLVKTLLNVYQEETKDFESKPLAIGGGTYAKEAKNIVAFGPTFPGRDYFIHDVDEWFGIDDFNKCLTIYAHAIYSLGHN